MSRAPAPQLYVAEPPAAWVTRPVVVVDCSVIAALLFDEPTLAQAGAQLTGRALHAPTLLPYEMANVAAKKQRSGALNVALVLADFSQQRIELHSVDPGAAFELAERFLLTAYDAAYLWLAAELNAPLVTFDAKLGKAAQRLLGGRA